MLKNYDESALHLFSMLAGCWEVNAMDRVPEIILVRTKDGRHRLATFDHVDGNSVAIYELYADHNNEQNTASDAEHSDANRASAKEA